MTEEQIAQLREIIALCRARGSRKGYFAALYIHVAVAVADALQRGVFAQPARLCLLHEIFFARYREAFFARAAGEPTRGAWTAAFDAAESGSPCTVQHLLLGMNAHINLDLAIAIAQAIPARELPAFRDDFEQMNYLLSSVLYTVITDLALLRPSLGKINDHFRAEETAIINFGMRHTREHAWHGAERLLGRPAAELEEAIDELDHRATEIAGMLARPVWPGNHIASLIRSAEPTSVTQILDDLMRP